MSRIRFEKDAPRLRGELGLWACVIADALETLSSGRANMDANTARNFLLEENDLFDLIVSEFGYDPARCRHQIRSLLKKGVIHNDAERSS